ncbi:Pol I core factor CF [Apophysomyces sp. BC1034]|nr:Pol I core factor CF [Apophysomyces sp. BC1021]KAG0193265.1 Pol I core factor CF [Apophysomyces sp. BC1034]
MVKAVKGVLLECDSTVKQIVLNLNKRGNFVIEDLDDTHLFIEASSVQQLQYELDRILDENSYTISGEDKENGLYVCRYGHQLLGWQEEEGEDEMDSFAARNSMVRKRKKVQAISDTFKIEKLYGAEQETAKVKICQYGLQMMARAFVHDLGFPPMFEHVVREIWLLYISTTNTILTDAYTEEEHRDVPNRRRSIEEDLDEEDFDEENHDKEHTTQSKGKWPALHFSHTMIFCYLACLWLRWPVMLNDIRRWCSVGRLPYARVLKILPQNFILRVGMTGGDSMYYIPSVMKIFRASEKYRFMFRTRCNVKFPDCNTPLLIYRCCRQFYLPVEMYFCVARLFEYYPKNRLNGIPGLNVYAELPLIELRIVLSVLVAVKLCYALDDDENFDPIYDDVAFTPLMNKKDWLTNVQKNAERWKEMHEKNDTVSPNADLSILLDYVRNIDLGDTSKYAQRLTSNMVHTYMTRMSGVFGLEVQHDAKQLPLYMDPPPMEASEKTADSAKQRLIGEAYQRYIAGGRFKTANKNLFHKEYELVVNLAANILGLTFENIHKELVQFEYRLEKMMRQ